MIYSGCKNFSKLQKKEINNLFNDKKSFRAIYTLTGNDQPDTYNLTDYDGNRIKLESLNGYEKGIILNDCFAYYNGNKYFNNLPEPHGVIDIQEF